MAFTTPQLNLILQMIILVILLLGFAFKIRSKFIIHGSLMLIAVILNAVSFFGIMGPSFLGLSSSVSELPMLSSVTIIHGILGAIAEVLGIYLVASWGLHKSTQQCKRKRNMMRVTLILWLASLLLGILLYAILYGII